MLCEVEFKPSACASFTFEVEGDSIEDYSLDEFSDIVFNELGKLSKDEILEKIWDVIEEWGFDTDTRQIK